MSAIATIDLGRIKFKWRGAYNAATAYAVDDVVSHLNSSWICVGVSTGNAPALGSAYWELMALGGSPNEIMTAQGDLLSVEGGTLVRKPIGAARKVLTSTGTQVEWQYPALLQKRSYKDRVRRQVANGQYYYFGAPSSLDNSLVTRLANSIIQFDVSLLTESDTHDTMLQFQYYTSTSGTWNAFPVVNAGQQGHLKIGQYPDSDYNSTPSSEYAQQSLALNLPAGTTVAFRIYVFNGGSPIFCGSFSSSYETAPCQVTISEYCGDHASLVERTV